MGKGFFHQGAKGAPLLLTGVLKFVQKKMTEAGAQAAERVRHTVIAFKHLPRQMGDKQAGKRAFLLLIVRKGRGQDAGHADGRLKAQGLTQDLPVREACPGCPGKDHIGPFHLGIDVRALFKNLGGFVLGQIGGNFIIAIGPRLNGLERVCQPGQVLPRGLFQQACGGHFCGLVEKGKPCIKFVIR